MIGWLIYSEVDAKKNEVYIRFYLEEGYKRGVEIRLIYREALEFGIKGSQLFLSYEGREFAPPDFVISRTIYPLLSRQLELMGIPVFNNAEVARICNDKALTYQYIARTGLSIIDTSFVKNIDIRSQIEKITKPAVIKAVDGHGGSQVFLLEEKDLNQPGAIEEMIEQMKCSDSVLQPLTGNKNSDLRVYVIGKDIITAVIRTANTGFRSNYSLGGEISVYTLSDQEKVMVNKIIELFDFGLVGIDFLIGNNGELIFNEIEDVVGARMLYSCTKINLVGLYLDFILNRIPGRV